MALATTPEYTLGEHLRKARLDAGLDQADLAELVGVSRPLISKWERNVSVPDILEYQKIVHATQATWLLSDEVLSASRCTLIFAGETLAQVA